MSPANQGRLAIALVTFLGLAGIIVLTIALSLQNSSIPTQ